MVSLFFKQKQKCNKNVIIYTCIIFASNLYFILYTEMVEFETLC